MIRIKKKAKIKQIKSKTIIIYSLIAVVPTLIINFWFTLPRTESSISLDTLLGFFTHLSIAYMPLIYPLIGILNWFPSNIYLSAISLLVSPIIFMLYYYIFSGKINKRKKLIIYFFIGCIASYLIKIIFTDLTSYNDFEVLNMILMTNNYVFSKFLIILGNVGYILLFSWRAGLRLKLKEITNYIFLLLEVSLATYLVYVLFLRIMPAEGDSNLEVFFVRLSGLVGGFVIFFLLEKLKNYLSTKYQHVLDSHRPASEELARASGGSSATAEISGN